jgi:CLIP-associating protein 1/2
MDQQAATLLNNLKRPAVNSDSKINALNSLKSDIKHYRVPESAQPTIFECLKLAITQQTSAHLAASAFSTLGHLIKRLSIQDASGNTIQQLVPRILPVLQERLGDPREPLRVCASQSMTDIYPYLASDVERIVREEALGGTHARQKETAIGWVVRMHNEQGMAFKSYVGPIVACLENADEHVRDAAKNGLVELFSDAPDRAKADLKKQLKAYAVRHGIEQYIIAQIGSSSRPTQENDMQASTRSLPAVDHVAAFAESINSEAAKPPPQETIQMDPIYVHTERELSDTMRDMLPHFEGKETEHNWMPRDKAVLKIRRLLKGNAPTEYHHAFMAGIKSLIDGILKVANTLRTTMATNGCQLVQELMKTLGPAMDSHTEILLQSFVKMSSATKHIAGENGRQTADTVFQHCTYNARVMQHIWNAYQDKNASTRNAATEWILTVLKRQAGYKSHFESSGGLDLTEKCIRKGLDDANPKVKEGTRAVYWTFAKVWTEKANAIMDKLDPKSRALLEKDANNPNAALHGGKASTSSVSSAAAPRPGGRSTLKELMAEQRRAKSTARNLPERPSSAMASMSPAKPKPEVRSQSKGPSKLRPETRVTSTASNASTESSSKGSSLMSGPVRRPRRPELQRPQTADPYASKRLLRPETPANGTPSGHSPKGTGPAKAPAPTNSASRSRAKTVAPPSREASPSIPRRSPLPSSSRHLAESRPVSKSSNAPPAENFSASRDDDMTMVLPSSRDISGHDKRVSALMSARPALDKTTSVDSGIPNTEAEDGFTMVLPNLSRSVRDGSPLNYRSPMKTMFDEAREKLDRPASSHSRKQSDPFVELSRKSPVIRRASPVKSASPQPAEVQIYEDPVASDRAQTPVNGERQVLSELPVNENVRVQSPTQSVDSHTSPAGSPIRQIDSRSPDQDRSEALRNRRLLVSGIERIRTRALDAHGFRRVQDLAKSQLDIWDNGTKYDELMSVLLDYLRSFPSDGRLNQLPSPKSAGLKIQALSVVRTLLTLQRKYASTWHANAINAVLATRQAAIESNVIADIERTIDEIVKTANPIPCIETLNEHLTTSSTSSDEQSATGHARATALSLNTLRALLLSSRSQKSDISSETASALAQTAARYLEHSDAEVRKADVELACEVFARFGEDKAEFWSEFRGVEEGRLGLLTYYIARRERAS